MRMSRRAGLLALGELVIAYTGSYTDELVTMDGSSYRLLTLTSSGTLSASKSITGDIWICGGGGRGVTFGGGGGGYAASSNNADFQNLTVTVGAGGTSSSEIGGQTSIVGDVSLTANGGNQQNQQFGALPHGGSGGGYRGGSGSGSWPGDGIAKTPFGSAYFPYPYCDGGGGGGYRGSTSSDRGSGGVGGTNGGNGGAGSTSGTSGGAGGGHYGGAGGAGASSGRNGAAATGYGSGGGGFGIYQSNQGSGGNGYQGVCFIRIPLE